MNEVLCVTFSLAYLFWRLFQARPERTARPNSRLRDLVVSLFCAPRPRRQVILLSAGLVAGGGAAWLWRGSGLELGGLLLGLLAAGLILEEFVDIPDQRYLPAVLGLLTVVQEEITAGKDVFAALAATLPRLTNTAVKRAVQEALRRFSARQLPEHCLGALRGVNPYLDEFAADVTRAGWENSPDLRVVLQLLFTRTSQAWDRARRKRIWVDRTRPSIRFGQAFVIGGVATGVALLAREVSIPFLWLIGAGVGAFVMRQVLSGVWFRRTALLTILVLGQSPLFSSASIHAHPEQTQVKSLGTHQQLSRAQRTEPIPLPVEKAMDMTFLEALQPSSPTMTLPPGLVGGTVDHREGGDPLDGWQCKVSTGSDQGHVNLRQGPGMHFPVLSIVAEGEWLFLLEETGDYWTSGIWRNVIANENSGWIYAPLCLTTAEMEAEDVHR